MDVLIRNWDLIWHGFVETLALVSLSFICALALGTAVAILRVSPMPLARGLGTVYVEIVRNVPAVVVFFFTVFVLPQLGISLPYFTLALIALTVYYGSFFAEAVRSGFNAVPTGQIEAGRALGLRLSKIMTKVVLPQAFRNIIPPVINVFIAMAKVSAIAGAFGVGELFHSLNILVDREPQSVLMVLTIIALLYLVITVPAGYVASVVERKVAYAR